MSDFSGCLGVTSRALKRKDNGVLSRKTESFMKSKGYGNPANRNEETPEKLLPLAGEAAFRAFLIGQKVILAGGLTRS
jgi:hypothetical protein